MMQIRKSEIRKAVQEHLQVWMSNDKPLGMISMRGSIEPADREDIEVDNEALDDAIKETLKHLEADATLRMQAESAGVSNTADVEKENFHNSIKGAIRKVMVEISGVDSLKPNDPHTPEDEAEKDAADDVMEQGDRPRGGPHIENVRFWKLDEKSLRYIIKDASEAVKTNPMARKASKWADEVNDAVTVLHWRKKKGIKEDGKYASPDPKLVARNFEGKDPKKKKDKIRRRPWVSGLDPAGGIGEAKEMEVKDKEGFMVDLENTTPKSTGIVKKMHDLVSKKMKLKSIEDVQSIKGGIAFIFGDPSDAKKMAAHLKKAGVLGKVTKLAAGGGKRTLVSLKS